MPSQACEPCAKRKVRCDREEPCSNCKRRKQDHCSYPELSPAEKIGRLEQLVRDLGGDPDVDAPVRGHSHGSPTSLSARRSTARAPSPKGGKAPVGSAAKKSKDPMIIEEDGQQYYLESSVWLVHGHRESGNGPANAKNPLLLKSAPPAFRTIICSRDPLLSVGANSFSNHGPYLWNVFLQRVHPFIRISFSWDLERLQFAAAGLGAANATRLDDSEDALVSSIYLAGAVSLSEVECQAKFDRPKVSLVSECQALCEEALARTNILCMKNIVALKAMAIYLMVGLDRLSTQSIWTLMGLAIRNGEKLGIHRDGTFLGLLPAQTEERRRLWWQLQYLDLILAIRVGVTPLTLMVDWDVKMPLNIEDSDLSPDMQSFPEERKGLTSMAYCLFTYYILDEQRRYHADKGQFELSWSTNQSVPMQTKRTFVDHLEDGLNKKFLQYCDPINPLHILLQLIARALTCVFRQRILLKFGEQSSQATPEQRAALLASSMQLLEYAVALHSHRLLKGFEWFYANGYPWPAFMVVLVEASQETDTEKCEVIWALLSDLYGANVALFELAEDRRKLHAAELIVAAWKTCQSKGTVGRSLPKPAFVSKLEDRLRGPLAENTQAPDTRDMAGPGVGRAGADTSQSFLGDLDEGSLFSLEFEDIDWSFWNSID